VPDSATASIEAANVSTGRTESVTVVNSAAATQNRPRDIGNPNRASPEQTVSQNTRNTRKRGADFRRRAGEAALPIAGRYHDSFHRIDGRWWFDTRVLFVDLVGDLSHHLLYKLG
jgi:hypothetical protein